MNHWIIVPAVLPAMTAAWLVLAARNSLMHQRVVSGVATLAVFAVTIGLYRLAGDSGPMPYLLGAWPAPYGIVLVLDRLSATMLMLSGFLSVVVLLYAASGWDARGKHFHALFQFQLFGINGAFLTGDVFNLFVFFEVMLIASYGLMLHGSGPRRLKAGFQYVTINLIASTLFLFAVGLIYAVTGTLNMADLAVKVREVSAGDEALLRTGALLLFLVFAVKAALVPLHWWLPATYAAASAPVAALFAIMTKVGTYSILRVYGMIFGMDAGPVEGVAANWILPAATVTLAVGTIGMLASRSLLDLVCFSVVASMGTLLIALGLFDVTAVSAALYYLVHSTIMAATLFLLVDLIADRRGSAADSLTELSPVRPAPLMGALFFLGALLMTGMPPLSGFIGKLLILDATRTAAWSATIWAMVLGTSLLMMIAYARAGSFLFWQPAPLEAQGGRPVTLRIAPVAAVIVLIAASAGLTLFAGQAMTGFSATATQALDASQYVRAVLGPAATAQLGGF